MMREYSCVIVGSEGVGKSALVIQLIQGVFVADYDPMSGESYRKQVTIDSETCILDIIDLGFLALEYLGMMESYLRVGEGFILTYSMTSRKSYEDMKVFRDRILSIKNYLDRVPIVVAGNKCDLQDERQVPKEEAMDLCETLKVPFYETSALAGINVEEVFYDLVREIKKDRQERNGTEVEVKAREVGLEKGGGRNCVLS
eukprot:TRINITY_DN2033_c0_g2_i2.p1 TRINITY_DN2033_c0_g2~~TRINITY_DN2033_c0_g2_i2.p1  ORF type:complete len:200 (+),score=37.67 TRINITY_DN2033_c0_g2_i2:80-679(+)